MIRSKAKSSGYSACELKKNYVWDNEIWNTVLPGIAYWYYTAVNMPVYLDRTNKTHLENDYLFWKYASAKTLLLKKKVQF